MSKSSPINIPVALNVTATQATGSGAASAKGQSPMIYASEQYANLDETEKAMWNLANNHVQSPTDPQNNTKRGANGWTLFYTCCMAQTDAGHPLVRTPAPIAIPENLPPIRVDISYNNNAPVINLVPNTAYEAGPTIVLWATPVVPLGNGSVTKFRAKTYRRIGVITGGLPVGGVNVASQFLSVFPSVPRSCKIGFKLQAVNPGGYHSIKQFTVGLTPSLTLAEATGQTEPDAQLEIG